MEKLILKISNFSLRFLKEFFGLNSLRTFHFLSVMCFDFLVEIHENRINKVAYSYRAY